MTFTWFGGTCIKVQSGDTVIAIDPDGAPGAAPRFRADIVLLTNGVSGRNSQGSAATFEITAPGEYELHNIVIQGFPIGEKSGSLHTCYLVEIEGMRLVMPGKLRVPNDIKGDIADELGSVDMLAIPVGPDALGATETSAVIRELEPRLAIPMPIGCSSERDIKSVVESVAKSAGGAAVEEMSKLVVRKNALDPEANTRIICLKPGGA